MPSEKLMPCPFCGGSIELRQMGDDKFVAILCETCQASGPNHYGQYEWNSRLTAAEQAEPAPTYDAPLGAIENGRVFLQRLEHNYDFQCEAGGLANCSDYHEAVRCFEAMAEWIYHHAPAARSGAVKVRKLEWNERDEALTIAGWYFIERYTDGTFGSYRDNSGLGNPFEKLEAAKAAAQADYEQRILAALEPAEPATDAEREFSEVLNEAEAFNDALSERMRRNARDWLRPDDEPATDAESLKLMNGSGLVWEESNPFYAVAKTLDGQIIPADSMREMSRINTAYMAGVKAQPESRLREALEEIADLKTVRDRPDDYNRGFADGRWQAVKIARAALAQGADDE